MFTEGVTDGAALFFCLKSRETQSFCRPLLYLIYIFDWYWLDFINSAPLRSIIYLYIICPLEIWSLTDSKQKEGNNFRRRKTNIIIITDSIINNAVCTTFHLFNVCLTTVTVLSWGGLHLMLSLNASWDSGWSQQHDHVWGTNNVHGTETALELPGSLD